MFCATLLFSACKSQRKDAREYYTVGTDTFTLRIVRDTIGFTLKQGATIDALKNNLREPGLTILQPLSEDVYTGIPVDKKNLDRKSLLELNNTILQANETQIDKIGYLAYPNEAKVPMIVTDEVIIEFKEGVKQPEIDQFMTDNNLEVRMQSPFIKTQYLVRSKTRSNNDALAISKEISQKSNLVNYSHPNFIMIKDFRFTPNDALFANQWHHVNTGQNSGTVDADIDTDKAWNFTFGVREIIIADLDDGFDMTHPDITPNFATNPGETPGNGIDDDGNQFIDDVIGWDFDGCGTIPCGDATPEVGDHGAATIGTAGARGRNSLGVIGSCPECSVIPIEVNYTAFSDALAFGYAQARGARVITCSWGYAVGTPTTANVVTAINTANAAGATILFAMNNINVNDCGTTPDISSLASVIAVSRSTNRDRFDNSGFGNCMDVLAPTRSQNGSTFGTLGVTTTDVQGADGYNSGSGESCSSVLVPADYTACFGGTSSATPLTAGVAGLILSLNNTLTPTQVQNLLQDCADRIEPSVGMYSNTNGFSTPATGNATHGYGRINAFEAVKIVAPAASGGRAGVDVFLRDNRLDWGNTEQPSYTLFEPTRGYIPHYESIDIKIDAPPFQPTPANNAQFDALVDERPQGSATNKVYVRVRNRGYETAASVGVKLHWVYAGLTFPLLPTDFWTSFPADAADVSVWHPVGLQTLTNLGYSGSSVAGTSADAAQVASFDFNAPAHDEAMPNHYCLMALVDSPQDPLVTPALASSLNMDQITPLFNNATHRNITIENTRNAQTFIERFFITNPGKTPIDVKIMTINPQKLKYAFKGDITENTVIRLKSNETRLVELTVDTKGLNSPAELRVEQVQIIKEKSQVMGGITFRFGDQKQ